jgi:hypothetical protein
VRGSDDGHRAVAIVESAAQLLHDTHQCGIRNERVWPESLVKLRLPDNARRLRQQRCEEVARFRRQVNVPVVARQLPPV